uniref:cytochrome-b5 reductase n=1 Tax=Oryza brachyantha TaxID=4533 RepID=J3M8B2_ORYBR
MPGGEGKRDSCGTWWWDWGMEFLEGQSTEATVAGCLDPENYKEFKLVEKRQISHDVAKFRFALPTPTSVLGLPIGQHISCRGQDAAGEEAIKPYTPTTLDSDLGYFELVIKEKLESMAETYPDHFKIYYVLNQPPEVWNGGVGFVSMEMIQTHYPAPAADIQILRCGLPPMNKPMALHLENLDYTKEMQFQF